MIVPPRKLAKRRKEDEIKPISGLDVEALLLKGGGDTEEPSQKKPKLGGRIGTDDPAKDFKELIDDDENSWKSGFQCFYGSYCSVFVEMEKVIRDVVSDSFADAAYDKAVKALRAYRAEAIEVMWFQHFIDCSLMNQNSSTTIFTLLRKIC